MSTGEGGKFLGLGIFRIVLEYWKLNPHPTKRANLDYALYPVASGQGAQRNPGSSGLLI